jgi:hypothetical protein
MQGVNDTAVTKIGNFVVDFLRECEAISEALESCLMKKPEV